MKFKIFKESKTKKSEKKDYKNAIELILFVFSMCTIILILILGMVRGENWNRVEHEYTPMLNEGGIYEIFELEFLKNAKTVDQVSDFGAILKIK